MPWRSRVHLLPTLIRKENETISNTDIQELLDVIDGQMTGDRWFTPIKKDIGRAILYSEQVAADIVKIANEVGLQQGLGRKEVAKALQAALSERFAQSLSYWQGLSATVLTRSSVMGTTQALIEAKAKTYEFLAVNDERTSEICRHLDGKIFKVEVARDIRDRLLNSKSPEEAKEVAPWPTGDRLQEALGTSNASDLAGMGIAVPALHFHCRSEIIVKSF